MEGGEEETSSFLHPLHYEVAEIEELAPQLSTAIMLLSQIILPPKPQRLEIKSDNISFITAEEGADGDKRVSLI